MRQYAVIVGNITVPRMTPFDKLRPTGEKPEARINDKDGSRK